MYFSSECLPMEAVIRFDVDQASRRGCWVLLTVVVVEAVVATDVGGRVRQLTDDSPVFLLNSILVNLPLPLVDTT